MMVQRRQVSGLREILFTVFPADEREGVCRGFVNKNHPRSVCKLKLCRVRAVGAAKRDARELVYLRWNDAARTGCPVSNDSSPREYRENCHEEERNDEKQRDSGGGRCGRRRKWRERSSWWKACLWERILSEVRSEECLLCKHTVVLMAGGAGEIRSI